MTIRMNGPLLLATLLLAAPAFALTMLPPPDMDHTPLHAAAKECDLATARTWAANPAYRDRKDRNDSTPLSLAAENGCLEVVRLLVESGAKVDAKGAFEQTPLLHAAEQGHAKVVAYLLGKGADVNAWTKKGDTPLILAMRGAFFHRGPEGDPRETLEALLKHGAEVNAAGEYGRTALIWAVRHADARLVWPLLRKGADPSAKDKDGDTAITLAQELKLDYLSQLLKDPKRPDLAILGPNTPLSDAVKRGNAADVVAVLDKGADVNGRFGNGSTALMQAASMGRADMVELLLKRGAQIDAKNGTDFTPLMFAASTGHDEVVKTLLAKGADVNASSLGRPALVFAAMNKHLESVRLLLERGADPDIIIGGTPLLTMAIKDGPAEIAGLLIARGAPVNVVDEGGKTPLMHACEKGDMATVKALLARGGDVNILGKDSEGALTIAIAGGHDGIVRLLLERGATVRTDDLQAAIKARNVSLASRLIDKGADVKDALLTALPKADLEMVKLLVKKGADPNARDYYQKTPLILEAGNWSDANPEVVRHLLEHGADINAQDDKGMSALLMAAGQGNAAVAQVLLAKGADITLTNRDGKTAWLLAAERGDRKMLELLEKAGAGRDYAGMSWTGYDAAMKEPFITVVDDRTQWEDLWKRAFDKPAPIVDFDNFAVACVFLGAEAEWLYSIHFDEPSVKDGVMQITYRLFMNRIAMEAERGFGRPSFGGQYRMEVYAKQKGVTMRIVKGKGEGDYEPLPLTPPPWRE
ncbi:Ankyrin repeat-like protein [Geobacter metallireducens RCH3]|uniref:Ankyrin repeat protein n=1 Tax=Geobacter metallireducens (strain ATCC 53774 / DSM 7210 / GS-15) TaxID=269799 RepID=Q39S94_GEOMG|nr:ankyrin repeat domain-containing protein [Geobacter metallireducens]ABB32880.1 ankyrin repeat protein [Geobacter metallireducens GS-15]EHP88986.1 Ankyrin repeat-like protein [Geobacter metallireducens RCH3]